MKGWLYEDALREIRRNHGWKWKRRQFVSQLRTPSGLSLAVVAGIALLVTLAFIVSSPNLAVGRRHGLPADLQTLWQVQAAVAGIALPLLTLAIQLAGDRATSVTSSSEILMRESWIFPIVSIALLGTIFMGIAAVWSESDLGLWLGLSWFVLTVLAAVFAYWRALGTWFNPLQLRQSSIELLKSKLTASLDESLGRRLANNRLADGLKGKEIDYTILGSSGSSQWVMLDGEPDQTITDINLRELLVLVSSVPRSATPASELSEQASPSFDSPPALDKPSAVLLLKAIGDQTRFLDRGLLALRADAFESLDRQSISQELRRVFRFEDSRG